jgi:hypothetical protein
MEVQTCYFFRKHHWWHEKYLHLGTCILFVLTVI